MQGQKVEAACRQAQALPRKWLLKHEASANLNLNYSAKLNLSYRAKMALDDGGCTHVTVNPPRHMHTSRCTVLQCTGRKA